MRSGDPNSDPHACNNKHSNHWSIPPSPLCSVWRGLMSFILSKIKVSLNSEEEEGGERRKEKTEEEEVNCLVPDFGWWRVSHQPKSVRFRPMAALHITAKVCDGARHLSSWQPGSKIEEQEGAPVPTSNAWFQWCHFPLLPLLSAH